MPNVGVHLLLAGRVLLRWSEPGADPPFRPSDRLERSSFLHCAILPDAGYFPRGDRLFSELAHLSRTADLLRALVEEAATPLQRASAWGWVTHVLADRAIHPLINEAHGEHVFGSRARAITSTEDEAGHMRLEYGLDASVFGLNSGLSAFAPRGSVPVEGVQHVRRAYDRVYGWSPSAARLLADHRMARRMARLSGLVARIHNLSVSRRSFRGGGSDDPRAAPVAVAQVGRGWFRSSVARALLHPLPPPDWLVAKVAETADSFADTTDLMRSGAIAEVPNHDLITGEVVVDGPRSLRRSAAEEALSARRRAGALPG
jgi:hypothetical protein